MQVDKVCDIENGVKMQESQKISVKPKRSQRRPLGDICNILPNETERKETVSPIKKQLKTEVIVNQSVVAEFNNECVQPESDMSLSPAYDTSETFDLEVEVNEILKKEKLYGVLEYVDDIYEYLRRLEFETLIKKRHLEGLELTEKMRSILVDWIIEVHSHFRLSDETLHLCIYILDRYSEIKRSVNKRNAQLIAVVAILLAAKYEETEPIDVSDIIFVTDSAITKNEVIRAERSILGAIDYNLSRPLSLQFLRRYSKVGEVTAKEHAYATYFCDAALLEYSACSLRPSILAAAALYLALCVSKEVIDIKLWNNCLIKFSTYKLTDFYHILPRIAMAVQLCSSSKLEAVKKKHSATDRFSVSTMPCVQPSIKGSVIDHFCQ